MDTANPTMQYVPLEQLRESPTNPRRNFGDLSELISSIATHGVLEPILARPGNGKGGFEIIAGARRFRAAKEAGKTEMPVVVRDATDEQVLEMQLVENAQRKDIDAIEEAEAYAQLHTKFNYTAEQIAERTGKSKASVYARMKLTALCNDVRKLVVAGRISPSNALVVARIPVAKLQKDAANEIAGGSQGEMSARLATEMVQQRYMLPLAKAPWMPGDPSMLTPAGACSACPKRTGNNRELFADVKDADVCTDPSCYQSKATAYWTRASREGKKLGFQILPADKSKDLFYAYGALTHEARKQYADLDASDLDGKTNRELLYHAGLTPSDIILARDARGGIHELVARSVVSRVTRKASSPNGDSKKQRKKEKENRAERLIVVAKLATKAEDTGTVPGEFWRTYLLSTAAWQSPHLGDVMLRRELITADRVKTPPAKAFEAFVKKAKPAQLWGLVVELLVLGHPAMIGGACKAFGVKR